MAIQSFQLDPQAGGVSVATFDAHKHAYDKMIACAKMSFCDPLTYTGTQTTIPE